MTPTDRQRIRQHLDAIKHPVPPDQAGNPYYPWGSLRELVGDMEALWSEVEAKQNRISAICAIGERMVAQWHKRNPSEASCYSWCDDDEIASEVRAQDAARAQLATERIAGLQWVLDNVLNPTCELSDDWRSRKIREKKSRNHNDTVIVLAEIERLKAEGR